MGVAYLAETAQSLLDAATAGLAPATTGHPLPTAIFVSHGPPGGVILAAGGCDLLTVHLDIVTHEPFADDNQRQSCNIIPTPNWVLTLLRCYPGPDKSPDVLGDAADALLVDLWALLTELYDRADANTLIAGLDEPCDIVIGPAEHIAPEGNVAGWIIPISCVANDAGPTGS